jgi:hypothetical protein
MCGRYRLTSKERYLRDHFGVDGDLSWAPRWNIAPTQQVPVVRQDRQEPKRSFTLLRWGLIPFWAKDTSIGFKTINAMSETAATPISTFPRNSRSSFSVPRRIAEHAIDPRHDSIGPFHSGRDQALGSRAGTTLVQILRRL